jgi:hypothetical protein
MSAPDSKLEVTQQMTNAVPGAWQTESCRPSRCVRQAPQSLRRSRSCLTGTVSAAAPGNHVAPPSLHRWLHAVTPLEPKAHRYRGCGRFVAIVGNPCHLFESPSWIEVIRIWDNRGQTMPFGNRWRHLAAIVPYSGHTQGGDLNRIRGNGCQRFHTRGCLGMLE